jgi:hypothetical protein
MIGTMETLREHEALVVRQCHHHGLTVTLVECGADGVRQPLLHVGTQDQAVHDDEQVRCCGQINAAGSRLLDSRLIQLDQPVARQHAQEAERAQILEQRTVGDALAARQRERNQQAAVRRQRQHRVGGRLHGVGDDAAVAVRAVRAARARPEQAHEVVDLGCGAHRRSAGARRVLLLDGHGRAQPVDHVDGRLLHAVEELLRVRRQRLDVATLALRIEGVEGERGLARPARAGDDHECTPGQVDIDPLQIMLPRVADDDTVLQAPAR